MAFKISDYEQWMRNCETVGALEVAWSATKKLLAKAEKDDKWRAQQAYALRRAELDRKA